MVIFGWGFLAVAIVVVAVALAVNAWLGRRHQEMEDEDRAWREVKLRYGQTGAGKGGG